MGAFTPSDVFNMDESPLSLFGNQSKRSINDVGICNEVEGCLSNKAASHFFLLSELILNAGSSDFWLDCYLRLSILLLIDLFREFVRLLV